ncbi:Copper chaperone CopZ [Alkalibacterium subtropicum]|uniref:Copper chaperone CopZ n=1 Tax=Alkalibacterium subtropicum TaxID=753702 RepID=A0A1I1L8F9_9LACT|nr:heavy-metal-associated domain-containing protein [Alkalibacterium subtropicum]SFC69286.1 Copper chaperone CopZ [Alkalibacterium subtropicum]
MNYQAKVEGMSCNGCANSVKAAFAQIDGVSDVAINLDEKQATLESSQQLTKAQLEEALADTSYTVESLN